VLVRFYVDVREVDIEDVVLVEEVVEKLVDSSMNQEKQPL